MCPGAPDAHRCDRGAATANAPGSCAHASPWASPKHFDQAAAAQHGIGAPAPVVEVARHDQRRVGRYLARQQREQPLQLATTMRLAQAQVHAHAMQQLAAAVGQHHAVQQPARLVAGLRHVVVGEADDRVPRQQRVAVIESVDHRVAAIGVIAPDLVGQKFVVGAAHAVAPCPRRGVLRAGPGHFLQEHQVAAHRTHRLAQFVQHEAATQSRVALVHVDGQHTHARWRRFAEHEGSWRAAAAVAIGQAGVAM